MIKIKIVNYKKFDYNQYPVIFDIILKNKKEKLIGNLIVDFKNSEVAVDFPRKLSYFERLAVLKEIFYRLCLTKTRRGKVVHRAVEEFKFVDKNSEEEFDTIISELLSYGKVNFNAYKKNERMIANIAVSSELILEASNNGSSYVELQPVFDMSYRELEVYKSLLIRYFDYLGIEIRLEDRTDYTLNFNPYYYAYTVFKVFGCQICMTGNTRGIE